MHTLQTHTKYAECMIEIPYRYRSIKQMIIIIYNTRHQSDAGMLSFSLSLLASTAIKTLASTEATRKRATRPESIVPHSEITLHYDNDHICSSLSFNPLLLLLLFSSTVSSTFCVVATLLLLAPCSHRRRRLIRRQRATRT